MKKQKPNKTFNVNQINADKERQNFMSTLSDKEQNQFKTVEQIASRLSSEDIPFYLFTLQPIPGNKKSLYHWNAGKYATFDKKTGEYTEEAKKYIFRMNNGLIYWIYKTFICPCMPLNATPGQKIDTILKIVSNAVNENIMYLTPAPKRNTSKKKKK